MDELPDCLLEWIRSGKHPSILLIEVDGTPTEVEEQLAALLELVSRWTKDHASAIDAATVELLWKVRRSCSQAMFELGPRKLNEDVVVPFENQLALLQYFCNTLTYSPEAK